MNLHHVISTILRHDAKQNSYKIALLRSIGDVALSFPDLDRSGLDIAVPLRVLSEYWIAYYWPFVAPERPILQGARATLGDELRQDMAFRGELSILRQHWERFAGPSAPSDGFLLIHEMRIARRRKTYPPALLEAFAQALRKISTAIRQPIQYAGPGNWHVFERPISVSRIDHPVTTLPGTVSKDYCLLIKADLWKTFHELSLWVEALCIHEWCLFTETVRQKDDSKPDRGRIYTLLTDRPDNRRPLTWEHNRIDILIMEGQQFICPWTKRVLKKPGAYDLDHLLPISVYPINELWNLAPSDRRFNQHIKRDRLPSSVKLIEAMPYLQNTYTKYLSSPDLSRAIRDDVGVRFASLEERGDFAAEVAHAAVRFIDQVACIRNVARF